MRTPLSLAMLSAALLACGARNTPPDTGAAVSPVLAGDDARDPHSFAEPHVARVTHVDLDLFADFTARTLSGTATLDVQSTGTAATLTLDTRGLHIEAVTDAAGAPLGWQLGDVDAVRGRPLQVNLDGRDQVRIHYVTSPDAPALQWLQPAQTAGGRHPYLFSQGQAILTRTWIPTQDSPGIRQTWSARIRAPSALTVVMSAEALGAEGSGEGQRSWRFRMQQPVAPYLIAIAIGDLAFRELGPRSGVYTEPAMIDAAADEFADLEAMLRTAESLYGPYRWGRYDVLVLPPSFPFGGMENPRLTFATPTILAGDRSLVGLIAHELAHSWSGNLVSNATWRDFWLNEGFTVYIEDRIMEAVYGPRAAAMLADLGWDGLQQDLAELDAADTRLHLDLIGRDPDEAMTSIAYEKGATFLRTIERATGRERFDAWLRGYFDRHAFQPQTSAGFLSDLRTHLLAGDAALEARIGPDEWVHGTGLPTNAVHVQAEAFTAVDAAASAFAADGTPPDAGEWSSAERVRFINRLPRELPRARLEALERQLSLRETRNSEVRFAWLMLAVANRYPPAASQVEDFLTAQGRRKFVLPLYRALLDQEGWGSALATRIYAQARTGYHAVTAGSVDALMEKRKE